jgi:hypothetical protein
MQHFLLATLTMVTLQQQLIVQLSARVADLDAQLNQHSQNSSKPPSSDPPSAPPRPPRVPRRRKPGGQAGHPLAHADALWTFVREENVEPTNNAAEQALRPAVLWRKGCLVRRVPMGTALSNAS